MNLLQNEIEAIQDAKKMPHTIASDDDAAKAEVCVDELVKVIGRVSGRLDAANDRIKRLEEAYAATEALHTVWDCGCCDSPDVWIRCSSCGDKIKRYHTANFNLNRTEEAKESKP